MDAAIPYRPDQGPYWPVGEVTSQGGPITVSVQADDVNRLQKLLGVDAPAVIGNLTAVNRGGFGMVPTASACGLYVDHIIGGRPTSKTDAGRQAGSQQEVAASLPLPRMGGVVGSIRRAAARGSFAEEGYDVVGLDADPQATLRGGLGTSRTFPRSGSPPSTAS